MAINDQKGAVMNEAMVTGRMSTQKKQRGARALERSGLTASQAINLLYDRIIAEGTDWLTGTPERDDLRWRRATSFVDGLPFPRESRFDAMRKEDIKRERLAAKGLM